MAGEPGQSPDGQPFEALVLPVDVAAVRRRVLRLSGAILAVGLANFGCAWFVYEHYGEADPAMPLWKLAVIVGATVGVGIVLVLLASRLYWRRTAVAISADALVGPALDPHQALLATPLRRMGVLPYGDIGRVVLEIRGGRIVSAYVFRRSVGLSADGISIPDYVRDVHPALLAIDERAGDRVNWMVPGRLRLRLRDIGRDGALALIRATAERC